MLLVIAAAAADPNVVAKDADPVICTHQAVGSEVGTHMRPRRYA
jgi:hypothetical protein